MENNHKILIAVLIGIIIILGGAIAGTLLKEPVKTVELFKNGTTVEVPENTHLESQDEFSTTYVTGKNTTIIAVDTNGFVGALASKMLSSLIVEKGEKQDNGLYLLDKSSITEIGDQLGFEYDENNIKDVYVGIKHNNTVNQSIIIIGIDQNEIISILNSIHWKLGLQSNASNTAEVNINNSASNGFTMDLPDDNSADNVMSDNQGSSDEVDDYEYDPVDYDAIPGGNSYSSSSNGGSSSQAEAGTVDSSSSSGGSDSQVETTTG